VLNKVFPYTLIPQTGQEYFQSGNEPKLLIVGQTHGDESEIVPLVENVLFNHCSELPPFLFVREISPSASKLGTRENIDGLDLNRSFIVPPPTEEVKQMMELWSKYVFDIFLTFHTDPTAADFYLYDGTKDEDHEKRRLDVTEGFSLLQQDLRNLGIQLRNGIDDSDDPTLGYMTHNGYVYWPMSTKINDHATDYWLIMNTGGARQVINPEIPGKASLEQKEKIIDSIIRRLILNQTDN